MMYSVLSAFVDHAVEKFLKHVHAQGIPFISDADSVSQRRAMLCKVLVLYNALESIAHHADHGIRTFRFVANESVVTRTSCKRAVQDLAVAFDYFRKEIASVCEHDLLLRFHQGSMYLGSTLTDSFVSWEEVGSVDFSPEILPSIINSAESKASFRLRILRSYPDLPVDKEDTELYKDSDLSNFKQNKYAQELNGFDFETVDLRDGTALLKALEGADKSVQDMKLVLRRIAEFVLDSFDLSVLLREPEWY